MAEILTGKDKAKQAAGFAAVDDLVKPGMKLGLGSGSTAIHCVYRAAELYRAGKLPGLLVVATSFDTELACREGGLSLKTLNDPEIGGKLDLAIDGADEIDPQLNLIKGGGGAHLWEKIVAQAADNFVVVADDSKLVDALGRKFPLPVEVVPVALAHVEKSLRSLGGVPTLRRGSGKLGPVVTDMGNFILDVTFQASVDPLALCRDLNMVAGVVENGFFAGMATRAYIAGSDGSLKVLKTPQS